MRSKIITRTILLITILLALNAQQALASSDPIRDETRTQLLQVADETIALRDGECFTSEDYTPGELLDALRAQLPQITFRPYSHKLFAGPRRLWLDPGIVYLRVNPVSQKTECDYINFYRRIDTQHAMTVSVNRATDHSQVTFKTTYVTSFQNERRVEASTRIKWGVFTIGLAYPDNGCYIPGGHYVRVARHATNTRASTLDFDPRARATVTKTPVYVARSIPEVIKKGSIGRRVALIKGKSDCKKFTLLVRSDLGEYYKVEITKENSTDGWRSWLVVPVTRVNPRA